MVVAIVVVLVGGVAVFWWQAVAKKESVDWFVAGTFDEGRGLLVKPVGDFGACTKDPEVEVISESAAAIVLSATVTDPDCDELVGSGFASIKVPLSEPLRGRDVTGKRIVTPPPANQLAPVPDVQGLNVGAATEAIQRFGWSVSVRGIDKPTAQVINQVPSAGARATGKQVVQLVTEAR